MNPALLIPTGIPRSGLVCWHDLYDPTSALASVPDLSGNGYSLQRGSTAGEDSNDPTWGTDGKGLVHTTDDYALTPNLSGVTMDEPFTCVIVSRSVDTTGKVLWAVTESASMGEEIGIGHSGVVAGRLMPYTRHSSSSVSGSVLTTPPDVPMALALVSDGALVTLWNLGNEEQGTVARTAVSSTVRIGVGCSARSTVTNIIPDATVYSHLFYSRALSNAEIQRIYRALKATWAARGVAIL